MRTTTEWDGRGLPTAVTDGTGEETTIGYDPLDAASLERSSSLPGFGTQTFTYTAGGERASV